MKKPNKNISLAFSPDTDDAFMVVAMQDRAVNCRGYQFDFISRDIQELNVAACGRQTGFDSDSGSEPYDITAISFAVYPKIAKDYLLMPVGCSIGDRYGPAVVVPAGDKPKGNTDEVYFESLADLRGKRIAVPGLLTTAYFSAAILTGGFTPVPMYFKDITGAVQRGEVDAGILIHERQLDFAEHGLRKLGDLGLLWYERFGLPLPLGGNAIRRDLGAQAIEDLVAVYRESVVYGLEHRTATLKKALEKSGAGIDLTLGDRYISMYVNEQSLGLSADVVASLEILYGRGAELGLCEQVNLEASLA